MLGIKRQADLHCFRHTSGQTSERLALLRLRDVCTGLAIRPQSPPRHFGCLANPCSKHLGEVRVPQMRAGMCEATRFTQRSGAATVQGSKWGGEGPARRECSTPFWCYEWELISRRGIAAPLCRVTRSPLTAWLALTLSPTMTSFRPPPLRKTSLYAARGAQTVGRSHCLFTHSTGYLLNPQTTWCSYSPLQPARFAAPNRPGIARLLVAIRSTSSPGRQKLGPRSWGVKSEPSREDAASLQRQPNSIALQPKASRVAAGRQHARGF